MDEEVFKQKLTSEQYKVLREGETEAPFSGKYVNEKGSGMYKCAACGQELFSSDTKFDSGTGWPSFDDTLPGAVEYREDDSHGTRQNDLVGLVNRTEVVCSKCKSHLGHVFDDLPAQSFGNAGDHLRQDGKVATKRHCINSVCLELAPTQKSEPRPRGVGEK